MNRLQSRIDITSYVTVQMTIKGTRRLEAGYPSNMTIKHDNLGQICNYISYNFFEFSSFSYPVQGTLASTRIIIKTTYLFHYFLLLV